MVAHKKVDPVAIPHDGPILVVVQSHQFSQSSDRLSLEDSKRVFDMVNDRNNGNRDNDDGNDDDSLTEECIMHLNLISQLRDAASLKDQLSSLRIFKSNIVQNHKQKKEKDGKNDDDVTASATATAIDEKRILIVLLGTYRIIFELCLSSHTPTSMKKAGYSCLTALLALHCNEYTKFKFDEIHSSVLKSIFSNISASKSSALQLSPISSISFQQGIIIWKNPVQTLFEMLTYTPTQSKIIQCHDTIVAVFHLISLEASKFSKDLMNTKSDMSDIVGTKVQIAVKKGFELCTALKVFLTILDDDASNISHCDPSASRLSSKEKQEIIGLCDLVAESLLTPLLYCRATSIDALSVCGMCFGQMLSFKWHLETGTDKHVAEMAALFLHELICDDTGGNMDDNTNTNSSSGSKQLKESLPIIMIMKGFASKLSNLVLIQHIEKAQHIVLIDPIASYLMRVSQESANDANRLWALKSLDTVMGRCKNIIQANIVTASIMGQIGQLSNDVLQLSLVTFDSPPCRQVASATPALFKSLVNLMGVLDRRQNEMNTKIESMDILVSRVLAQPASRKGKYIALETLLHKVGASKLIHLAESQGTESLMESFINEIGDRGNSAGVVAELLGKILSLLREEMHKEAGIDLHRVDESKKKRRRMEMNAKRGLIVDKQEEHEEQVLLLSSWFKVWTPSFATALLCPDITRRNHISSYCLSLIATMVGGPARKLDACHSIAALLAEIDSRECSKECIVWAKLEVIRYANVQKLLKQSLGSQVLRHEISKSVTFSLLKTALIHESSRIRLVAFQTIGAIILSLSSEESSTKSNEYLIMEEMNLWTEALPYSYNCSERDYLISLNSTLKHFLHRIAESDCVSNTSILKNFIDACLGNLFCKQGYPGTIPEKESFALKMIETIIDFTTGQKDDKRETRRVVEASSISKILAQLVSTDVLCTLLSLLHSMWDATRESSFTCICRIIDIAQEEDLKLPENLIAHESLKSLQARATHLSSSPRQREADTGAKLLTILCLILPSRQEQIVYFDELSTFMGKRLELMANSLGVTLNPGNEKDKCASNVIEKQLPLAHGFVQALRLIIESKMLEVGTDTCNSFTRLAKLCCRAIEISLVVVADIDDQNLENENISASSHRWQSIRAKKSGSTPMNINTGALGANASFASSMPVDDEEMLDRLSIQRIMVGSWLLTKEACATLSSVIISFPTNIDIDIVSTAGDLLISTIISLKHHGAAFAAHKSLQKICRKCSSGEMEDLRLLPSKWSQRLLNEISSPDNVRDSTLRRSTGYGLGTLSILREEDCSGPRLLFRNVISKIILLSLPSKPEMEEYLSRWSFSSEKAMLPFVQKERALDFVKDGNYEWRTRIHALNILRLVILDAPLQSTMVIGDSLVSALIGYSDASWNVRNSSTMTFAAAMLRVVDADKNAGRDSGINAKAKAGTSAITATELFRCYPSLATVLLKLIQEETDPNIKRREHPVLFPLLLLLSRLQPISLSKVDPNANDVSHMFINPVVNCLQHRQQKVRIVAARALGVLCSGDDSKGNGKECSRGNLINKCANLLNTEPRQGRNHNQDHGVLLALKSLIVGTTNSIQYFNDHLKRSLLYFGTWGCYKGSCSPVSTVIALEIWHHINQIGGVDLKIPSTSGSTNVLEVDLRETVDKLVQYVELVSDSNRGQSVLGFAALASNVAKVAVEIEYPVLFEANNRTHSHQTNAMQKVGALLCSKSHDIMLNAAKAFKKKVCDSVDMVIDQISTSLSSKLNLLQNINQMLISSLFAIMDRDGKYTHPPTIRRLTRCIIEVSLGCKSLDKQYVGLTMEKFLPQELFQKFMAILEKDNETMPMGRVGGNALELMGLTIPGLCISPCADDYNDQHLNQDLSNFLENIRLSTNPETNWKVRYSAASSIKESCLLSFPANVSQPFECVIKQYQVDLYCVMISLLLDSDEDIRKIAAKGLLSQSLDNPTASLRNLEVGYCIEKDHDKRFNDHKLSVMYLNQIVYQCQNIERDLLVIMKEFQYSMGKEDLHQIQNLSTTRKIFEEEDRNTFEETLLIVHFSVYKLTSFSGLSSNMLNNDGVQTLLKQLTGCCTTILDHIIAFATNMKRKNDFAHDLSWSIKVFPGIHSILISAACLVCSYDSNLRVMTEKAKILRMKKNLNHPCVTDALNILSEAKYDDETTRNNVLKCCFLVPSQQMQNNDCQNATKQEEL